MMLLTRKGNGDRMESIQGRTRCFKVIFMLAAGFAAGVLLLVMINGLLLLARPSSSLVGAVRVEHFEPDEDRFWTLASCGPWSEVRMVAREIEHGCDQSENREGFQERTSAGPPWGADHMSRHNVQPAELRLRHPRQT
jgi:hypothetical protein